MCRRAEAQGRIESCAHVLPRYGRRGRNMLTRRRRWVIVRTMYGRTKSARGVVRYQRPGGLRPEQEPVEEHEREAHRRDEERGERDVLNEAQRRHREECAGLRRGSTRRPATISQRSGGRADRVRRWLAGGHRTLRALRSIAHALRAWPTPLGASINTSGMRFDTSGRCLNVSSRFQLEIIGRQVVDFCKMRSAARGSR